MMFDFCTIFKNYAPPFQMYFRSFEKNLMRKARTEKLVTIKRVRETLLQAQ